MVTEISPARLMQIYIPDVRSNMPAAIWIATCPAGSAALSDAVISAKNIDLNNVSNSTRLPMYATAAENE